MKAKRLARGMRGTLAEEAARRYPHGDAYSPDHSCAFNMADSHTSRELDPRDRLISKIQMALGSRGTEFLKALKII